MKVVINQNDFHEEHDLYANLNDEIAFDILSRLPIEDIIRCKSVCKPWYMLIKDSFFINSQMKYATSHPQRILLGPKQNDYSDRRGKSFLLVDAENKDCRHIPIRGFKLSCWHKVIGSCNGLLCIASAFFNEPMFICNPITGEFRRLPEQNPKYFIRTKGVSYGFGFDHVNQKYKVICVYRPDYWYSDGIIVTEEPVTTGEIITKGEVSWRKLEFPYQLDLAYGSGETVFYNGAFHWMITWSSQPSGTEQILSLDLTSEKFRAINVSPSVSLSFFASLISFGESMAFVDSDSLDDWSKIWIVVDSETDEYRFLEHTCKYISEMEGSKYFCRVVGMLSNGSYLYQATRNTRIQDGQSDHLGLYDPNNKESLLLNIHRSHHSFQTLLFTPTLVSPTTIFPPFRKKNFGPAPRLNVYYGPRDYDYPSLSPPVSPCFSMDREWDLRKGQALRKRRGTRVRRKVIAGKKTKKMMMKKKKKSTKGRNVKASRLVFHDTS